jgi:alpha-glucosidase (family GH31 glycosyl hydrolase)
MCSRVTCELNGKTQGLLSRDGWAVIDDTYSARYVPGASSSWPWWNASQSLRDMYLLISPGLNFKAALADYMTVAGLPALPPRRALGVWWSRYWPYSATTIVTEVLNGYKNNSIPLDVLVLDMDWGNFDWNKKLFPDPSAFCDMIHSSANPVGHPLAMSLNLHPDTGVDWCDSRYAAIAQRMVWMS